MVAGLHFPVDSAAGYALGRALASYFVALAKATKRTRKAGGVAEAWRSVDFEGKKFPGRSDWRRPEPPSLEPNFAKTTAVDANVAGAAPLLAQLWTCAQAEQRDAGFQV